MQFDWGVEFATALRSACQDATALYITYAVWLRSWIYICTQMGLSEQSYLGYYVYKLVDKLNLPLLLDELDWTALPSTWHVQFGWGVEFASALIIMSLSKQQSLEYFHLTSPCGGWVGWSEEICSWVFLHLVHCMCSLLRSWISHCTQMSSTEQHCLSRSVQCILSCF